MDINGLTVGTYTVTVTDANNCTQSISADITRIAMVHIAEYLARENKEDVVRMLIQVHDELVFEVDEKSVKEIATLLQKTMETIVPLEKTMVSLETQKRLSKYALREKDIVMARRGEMGRCAIVKKENVGWLCGTGSLVIRANGKFVDEQFLNLYLSSSKAKEYLEKSSIGATMNNLNQGILHELPIAIPNVQKQKQLISNFEAIGAETKRLEATYQQKIVALDELKKTLLQKAFRGELDTERVVRV